MQCFHSDVSRQTGLVHLAYTRLENYLSLLQSLDPNRRNWQAAWWAMTSDCIAAGSTLLIVLWHSPVGAGWECRRYSVERRSTAPFLHKQTSPEVILAGRLDDGPMTFPSAWQEGSTARALSSTTPHRKSAPSSSMLHCCTVSQPSLQNYVI